MRTRTLRERVGHRENRRLRIPASRRIIASAILIDGKPTIRIRTMDVSLPPEMERRIAERVASGRYATASEVVREGLMMLFDGETARQCQLDSLRADIEVGFRQALTGELIPGEQVHAELTGVIDGG